MTYSMGSGATLGHPSKQNLHKVRGVRNRGAERAGHALDLCPERPQLLRSAPHKDEEAGSVSPLQGHLRTRQTIQRRSGQSLRSGGGLCFLGTDLATVWGGLGRKQWRNTGNEENLPAGGGLHSARRCLALVVFKWNE